MDMPAGAENTEPGVNTPAPLRKGEMESMAKNIIMALMILSIYNSLLIYKTAGVNCRL